MKKKWAVSVFISTVEVVDAGSQDEAIALALAKAVARKPSGTRITAAKQIEEEPST